MIPIRIDQTFQTNFLVDEKVDAFKVGEEFDGNDSRKHLIGKF